MRNSCRTRMIAWVIAIIMVLCAVPVTSMANTIGPRSNDYEDEYVVNDYAECSVYYLDKDNKPYTTPKELGQTYKLILNASDTELAQFPKEGELVYYLPEKVGTVSKIEGNNIASARQSESGDVVFFTLSNADQGAFTAEITFESKTDVYDLYNIVNINGTYYRIEKTYIRPEKSLQELMGTKLKPNQYEMPEYDFSNLTITISNVDYVFNCEANAEKIANGANYYTVKFDNLDVVPNKIGAINKTTNQPNWLIPESERYDDPEQDSFHANYKVTLYSFPHEQVLYNMLKVNNSNDYYRLRKTKIIAKDAGVFKDNEVITEYTLIPNEEYDFTGVTIELDGEIYEYSPTKLTGEYYSYFTVTPDKIWKKSRINGNADWYKNPKGFLDGSASEFTEANDTISIHRDYIATTYKGTMQRQPEVEKSVTVTSDWPEGKPAFMGTKITLTAHPVGFDGEMTIQWQRSTDNEHWDDIEGANAITYEYVLNEDTEQIFWRVVVEDAIE